MIKLCINVAQCADCVYWKTGADAPRHGGNCLIFDALTRDTFYCAYAQERKKKEG